MVGKKLAKKFGEIMGPIRNFTTPILGMQIFECRVNISPPVMGHHFKNA